MSSVQQNKKVQLMIAYMRKALKMIVESRSGLPGNVRNPDATFGILTKQLNHGDSSMLDDVTWDILRCPMEVRVSLCFSNDRARFPEADTQSEMVLEHWRVKFAGKAKPSHMMDDKAFYERLSVAIRSLQAMLAVLPAYSFIQAQLRHLHGGSMAASLVQGVDSMQESGGTCRATRLETIGPHSRGTRGIRFERLANVPSWMLSSSRGVDNAGQNIRKVSTSSNSHPTGILRVDLYQHANAQQGVGSFDQGTYTEEILETRTSYGPLQVSVHYREKIVATNMEVPRIINNYYVAASGAQTGRTQEGARVGERIRRMSDRGPSTGPMISRHLSQQGAQNSHWSAGETASKPVAIPMRESAKGIVSGARPDRIRRYTHSAVGNAGIRSVRQAHFSPALTTGLSLMQSESRRKQNAQSHQQQHQQLYGTSAPVHMSHAKDDGSLQHILTGGPATLSPPLPHPVGSLNSNPGSLSGTPPLHPHRSPSVSPNIGTPLTSLQLNPSTVLNLPVTQSPGIISDTGSFSPPSELLNPPSGIISVSAKGLAGQQALDPNVHNMPLPFLASSAPRNDLQMSSSSPFWSGLPSPHLGSSPPMLGIMGYMGNFALNSDAAAQPVRQPSSHHYHQQQQHTMSIQQFSHNQQQQILHQQSRQPLGMTAMGVEVPANGMAIGVSPSSMSSYGSHGSYGSYGSYGVEGGGMLSYLNHRQNIGVGGLYGTSPNVTASGWIEYTRTAGTRAPDSFSPWGQTLGVVASRSRAAAKNEALAKRAGVSYARVDTTWLVPEYGGYALVNGRNVVNKPASDAGALAVDVPPPSDNLSRVGAFLHLLSEHENAHQLEAKRQEDCGGGNRASCWTVADALKLAASKVKMAQDTIQAS